LIDKKVAANRNLQEWQKIFTEPENWPPNSPDLNPMDYSVWGRCNRWLSSHNFRHWSAETHANRLS